MGAAMFTIEHGFDATVITLVDEGPAPLQEDVTVTARDDAITLAQEGPGGTRVELVLSAVQLRELALALDLPEGLYRAQDGRIRRQDPG